MKNLLALAFVAIVGNVQAGISEKSISGCVLIFDSLDNQLEENQSKYTFVFTTLDGSKNRMIYSIDGIESKAKLENNSIEIVTTPGKHIFQFYYSQEFSEVYTDSLEVKNRHHTKYEVIMFQTLNIEWTVDKPVIYLYPEKEIDVELNLTIKGEPTFFYPEYKEGWKFKASPSGDLTFDDKTYNYLFWEASQALFLSEQEMKTGFNVRKDEVTSFLEEKLSLAGLNSKEKADFITYWGPRLAANDLNFVRFEFNLDCNRYAEIEIDPKPVEIYRIYIIWMEIDQEMDVEEQTIQSYNREGFTVLEWGGSEIEQTQEFPN